MPRHLGLTRRNLLQAATAASLSAATAPLAASEARPPALVAITLDLEMSRQYPRREIMEWDFEKGNLDNPTKAYAVRAAQIVKDSNGVLHFFCVGRVLEQPNVDWLKEIAAAGHPIGNHTYDHVNVLAKTPADLQFRFQRAPWLIDGKAAADVIRENTRLTSLALQQRVGIRENGFRTPGGFATGLAGREDIQQLLLDLGYRWVSSKYPPHPCGKPKEAPPPDVYDAIVAAQRESQPFVYPTGLIEIPMSPISDVNAFRSHFWKLDYFLTAVERAVKWTIEHGAVFDFLAHPSCLVVEDPQFETIQLICRLVKEAGASAKLVSLDDVARRVKEE